MSFDPNEMMMDLFRSEVETHSESLSHALLRLERTPEDTAIYDEMMRSAHSIKGAARIVRVESAVNLAHIMEDCFVAAQREELRIQSSDFDLLLRSVDLLVRISEGTKDSGTIWETLDGEVANCVRELKNLRAGIPSSTDEPKRLPEQVRAHEPTATVPAASPASTAPQALHLSAGPTLFRDDAENLRTAIIEAIQRTTTLVELDLSQTVDIDPPGLAFLDLAKRWAESRSVRLRFHPVSDEMKVVLRVAGIAER